MENLATTKTKNYAFELLKNERNWLREVLRDKENDSNILFKGKQIASLLPFRKLGC